MPNPEKLLCNHCNELITTPPQGRVEYLGAYYHATRQCDPTLKSEIHAVTPRSAVSPEVLDRVSGYREQVERKSWVLDTEYAALLELCTLIRMYFDPSDPWERIPLKEKIEAALTQVPADERETLLRLNHKLQAMSQKLQDMGESAE